MSSHPALPIELVEEIIDNLRNDLPALSNCALVCRAWLPRAHFHRFADISLSISSLVRGGSRRDKLHEIVGHNASLLLHIHSLHLHAVNILGSSVSWHRVRKTPPLCPGLVTLRSLSLSQFEVCTLTELLPTICALPVLEDLVLDRIRVHPCRSPSHIEHVGPARQVRACRSLKALRFIGEAIGESILEAESSRFASNLMETGALRPESIESLALLSGARACAGWVPLLPSMATSLQHCAVSLHELCVHGELAESAREHIMHVYDALRPCTKLRSLCIQYNTTSTLMQCVFEGATHAIPSTSPFFLDAFCDMMLRPEQSTFPFLEELSLIVVGSHLGLTSCATALDRLAAVLMDMERFSCFRKVSVRVDEPRYVTGLFPVERSSAAAMHDEQGGIVLDLLRGFGQHRVHVETEIRAVDP